MQETLHLSSVAGAAVIGKSATANRSRILHFAAPKYLAATAKPPQIKSPANEAPPPPPVATDDQKSSQVRELLLYLDSLGVDSFYCLSSHPPLISAPIERAKSNVEFLVFSLDLSIQDIRRILPICPELLTSSTADVIIPAVDFLLREARVESKDLRHVIHRRPRLLTCSVENQLRPTLYFLQGTVGIEDASKHAPLLSCSVEKKFVPRIAYLQELGFPYRDAVAMFRRFPPLFCYGIEANLKPKFDYFVMEMGRGLKELVEFPQYFSFSLEKRIKARHSMCVDRGVCLKLPTMLKLSDERFLRRLDLCCGSSSPARSSPLWSVPPISDQVDGPPLK